MAEGDGLGRMSDGDWRVKDSKVGFQPGVITQPGPSISLTL